MSQDLVSLEKERARLCEQLAGLGDFRRGSVSVNYRRCGKSNCACCKAKHPGHGPQYLLTTKIGGRSKGKNVRCGPELKKVQEEVSNHQRFRDLVRQIVEVNEQICELRPVEATEPQGVKKTLPSRSGKRLAKKSKDLWHEP